MNSSQSNWPGSDNPWGPPDPIRRADQPSAVDAPPARGRRRGRAAIVACTAGLLVGTASAATIVMATNGQRTSAPPTTHVAAPAPTTPSATNPSSATPATDVPNFQSPSRLAPSDPRTTVPITTPSSATAGASQHSSSSDLTVGVVNIDTVLGYQRAKAAGTGIVLTANGEVLTNNHVIEGATKITATIVATGTTYTASVVGTDPSDDIAILSLSNASGLATARLGDSSTVKPGDQVTGVGNAGGTGRPTMASGAVVDLGQTITATDETGANAETLHNLIQISANLQPGESGGPLYDADGKVIGVDAAGSVTGGFRFRTVSTQGFAIPINDALAIAKQIEAGQATAKITIGTPPLLGVAVDNTDGVSGVGIANVSNGTPAASIGLQAGDVIVGVGNATINTTDDLSGALHSYKAGDKVSVTWTDSNDQRHTATATLITGPAD